MIVAGYEARGQLKHAEAGMETTKDILIVEDDAAVRDAMTLVLEVEGYRVTAAEHGRAALEYLRRNPPPRLILLDLLLPVMDGWEFRREQLQDPALAAIPVVVLTAVDSAQGHADSLQAHGYIQKPIEAGPLLATVRLFVMPREPEILLVQGQPAISDLVASGLRTQGFRVHRASCCTQAIDLYRQHSHNIALVLLDPQLPRPETERLATELRQVNAQVRCCFLNRPANDATAGECSVEARQTAAALDEAVHILRQLGQARSAGSRR
jgi:CheY-like chemotaxis protein